MSKRLLQAVSGLILLLATLAPMAELFDHWDKPNGPDSEIRVTVVFVSAGVVLTLTHLVRGVTLSSAAAQTVVASANVRPRSRMIVAQSSAPTASPPLLLRI